MQKLNLKVFRSFITVTLALYIIHSPVVAEEIDNRPVEVRLRMLADRLAQGFKSLPGKGRYERIIVAKFSEHGEQTKDRELGLLISAQLATLFKRDHGFLILEREKLAEIFKEAELAMSGVVDPSKAAKIGKMAGAQALVVGSVSQAGANYIINTRLISAESGSVLVAENINIPRIGLVTFSRETVLLRTRAGAVFRSALIPGWGQFYNREPIKGGVVVGAQAALIGAAVATHFLGQFDESAYVSDDFAERNIGLNSQELATKAQSLRERAQDYYLARNILVYSAIAVWVYNIVDAYIFGIDGDREASFGNASVGLTKSSLTFANNGFGFSF